MFGKSKVPVGLWLTALFALIYTGAKSSNLAVSIPVLLYPLFLYRLFWKSNSPNVLFAGLLFQWLSVSVQLIYSTLFGITLEEYMQDTPFPGELMEYTEWLSIIALYAFAGGIFVAVRNLKVANKINDILFLYSPAKVLRTYVVVALIINVSQGVIWLFPGVVQYIYFLFYIKWGFFIVTFYVLFKDGGKLKNFMFLIILIEFGLGLFSFFSSSFLNILVFSLIGAAAINPRLSIKGYFLFGGMIVLLFHICVLWTASKQEYRQYLNQGEISQVVTVSREDAFQKLSELVTNVDSKTYQLAIEALVDRIGYIQYFAAAIRYVPNVVPHEHGKVYLAAIEHYLVPRFLDPNKEILDDSKHTNQYTGLGLSGAEKATSFSLGTVADAYIDFGPVYMVVPVFLFGYLFGFFFSYLYTNSPNELWSWVLTVPFFILVNVYAVDTTKALGFILIYFITIAVLRKQLIARIDPLMRT